MDVSIIIVNYNTKDLTMQCIDSVIEKTTDVKYEIILVDNASADGSVAALKAKYNDVIVIESPTNLGFGRANNLGVKSASGKYLFFLNSDTILLNNAIYHFFNFAETNPQLTLGVAGCVLKDAELKETLSWGVFPTKTRTILETLRIQGMSKLSSLQKEELDQNKFIQIYGNISGADMFMLKSVFCNIGEFDDNIFMYYEETDLQRKLEDKGYKQYLLNTPDIIHLEGQSSKTVSVNNFKRMIILRSMFYYFRKHSNSVSYILFRLVYLALRVATFFDIRYSLQERKDYLKLLLKF